MKVYHYLIESESKIKNQLFDKENNPIGKLVEVRTTKNMRPHFYYKSYSIFELEFPLGNGEKLILSSEPVEVSDYDEFKKLNLLDFSDFMERQEMYDSEYKNCSMSMGDFVKKGETEYPSERNETEAQDEEGLDNLLNDGKIAQFLKYRTARLQRDGKKVEETQIEGKRVEGNVIEYIISKFEEQKDGIDIDEILLKYDKEIQQDYPEMKLDRNQKKIYKKICELLLKSKRFSGEGQVSAQSFE